MTKSSHVQLKKFRGSVKDINVNDSFEKPLNALEGLQFQFNVVCAYCISDNNSPLLKTTGS